MYVCVCVCACVCVFGTGHMRGSSDFSFISSHPFALPKKTTLHRVTLSSAEEISPSVLAADMFESSQTLEKVPVINFCMKSRNIISPGLHTETTARH